MTADWDQNAYARFRAERVRPALDLMMQIETPPSGGVFDLGCGDGAVAAALRARFPKRRVVGVDSSASMLAKAAGYHATQLADIADWSPGEPAAVIFSNAALHWLGDHHLLLPRLAGKLERGGVLAVQMPRQFGAPSHRFLRDIAASMFPGRFDFAAYIPPVAMAADYWRMLQPLGQVNAWETEYIQHLAPTPGMHPVRAFTESTAMRPIAGLLTSAELATFLAAYEAALSAAYPVEADGSVLFPFRRVFFTLVAR
ncbi:MAG: methyltransferase domain-containing protein [Aestuariivirga sp.]